MLHRSVARAVNKHQPRDEAIQSREFVEHLMVAAMRDGLTKPRSRTIVLETFQTRELIHSPLIRP